MQIDVNVTQKPAFNTVHPIEKQHEEVLEKKKTKVENTLSQKCNTTSYVMYTTPLDTRL